MYVCVRVSGGASGGGGGGGPLVGCIGSKMKERDLWDLANRQMTVK